MKRPTVASLKKVTAENLAGLGVERLADILVSVAEARPDLKRRLRMELAAAQGPEHLVTEIDKRLASLETSRGKIGWRQRPAFVRDVDALRRLIAERLAPMDVAAAVERLWTFMDLARRIATRFKDRDGTMSAVFGLAAGDLGRLLTGYDPVLASARLVDALAGQPAAWGEWLPQLLESSTPALAEQALRQLSERRAAPPGWLTLARHLADATGDVDAFRATYPKDALATPPVATQIGRRLLAAGRVEEAGRILGAAAPKSGLLKTHPPAPDFDWESAWIDYLDRAGETDAAQQVRWASFKRTLSLDRAKAHIGRLTDFADVEAEALALDHAARHADFERGLRFLMEWPAFAEAGRMILARADDVQADPDEAEGWAAKLRRRQPAAAELLLRKAAAIALRRRDVKTAARLTEEADTITP